MKDLFKKTNNKNKANRRTTKRISKQQRKTKEGDNAEGIETYSDISGDFFEEDINGGEYDKFDETQKETANEKRLRIAKEIIRKKRQMMQDKYESEESAKEDDIDFPLQARVDLVKRNKSQNLDHIFGVNVDVNNDSSQDLKKGVKSIDNEVLEKEFQKDIYEKENRVIYPMYDVVKKSIESDIGIPFITLNAHKRPITFCRFDPHTNDLITVGKDSAILRHTFDSGYKKKFLISAGFPKHQQGHKDEILTCDISFDGQYLATAGKDRIIKLWNLKLKFNDVNSKKEQAWLWDFQGHRADITAVRFKENSHDLVSLSEDRTLKIWDCSRRAFMENLFGHASDPIWLERLGNKFMISSGYDGTPILWKLEQEKIIKFQKQLFSLGTVLITSNLRLHHRSQ
jgi:hypothetical protein